MLLTEERYNIDTLLLSVVDDNQANRLTMTSELEYLGMTVRPLEGPFLSEDAAFAAVYSQSKAVICDHHLSQQDYASFSGAQLVARCYREKFPAVLVTRYSSDVIEEIRPFRHLIPALLTPKDLTDSLDNLHRVLTTCMKEVFLGQFDSTRRPWQTLLRVEDVDQDSESVFFILPAWDAPDGDNAIKIPLSMIPNELHQYVIPEARFFAKVNIGAERHEDIYIKDFEFRG